MLILPLFALGGRIIQPVQVEAYLQSHNMAKILYHVLRSNNVTFALEYRARARARARARNLRVRAQNFLRALAFARNHPSVKRF